ncbi:MAG: methionine--tRNA ligase [Ignisphaera sp.]|nr:methionine--tRNA ligase [Ignisphaera sp.]
MTSTVRQGIEECYMYVTTPIYYPNDKPHLGHAYTTILADVISRWFSLLGYNVYFLTGTDEHGLKLQREADKRGVSTKEFVDQMAGVFKEYWKVLGIGYSRFIRTTEQEHEEVVKYAVSRLWDRGYIYPGKYKGWYCTACEKFYGEGEYIIENNTPVCPTHRRYLEYIEEDTYFLRLSLFKDQVIKLLREGSIVYPKHFSDEVLSKIESEGLQDLSIARPKSRVSWGIELPFDSRYVIYVWIDALLNYLTGLGYPKDMNRVERYWKNSVQLIGKDILWFHTAIWFALLAMLDLPPPNKLLVHSYLTVKGQKMGKSLGNVVSIDDMIKRYGNPEVVRFIIARIANYDKDVEVSWDVYDSIYTGDLLNNYGNLVRRATTLTIKTLNGRATRDLDGEFANTIDELKERSINLYNSFEISGAIKHALDILHETNAYINRREPWRTSRPNQTIYTVLEAIRIASLLFYPIMPVTVGGILNSIGLDRVGQGLEQFRLGYVDEYSVRESPIPFKKLQ